MNRIKELFKIQYPIIQAGMVWCSGWKLASAVSNAGGLGLIGAGSMRPEILDEHLTKCKEATNKPYGVNVPLLYPEIDKIMDLITAHNVGIVFTSAGNPRTWTKFLKDLGITVVHVVSSKKFALKAQAAGVDAVVAEGFEAGGHNGREETTSMVLIPLVRSAIEIPLIAAGGLGSGKSIAAAMALGAEGAQIGSRFAASAESSAHPRFKDRITHSEEGDTILTLKALTPVRLIKNSFYDEVKTAENSGASPAELSAILGQRRARRGIFEGDLDQGELEIGQIAAGIHDIKPAANIVADLVEEFNMTIETISAMKF